MQSNSATVAVKSAATPPISFFLPHTLVLNNTNLVEYHFFDQKAADAFHTHLNTREDLQPLLTSQPVRAEPANCGVEHHPEDKCCVVHLSLDAFALLHHEEKDADDKLKKLNLALKNNPTTELTWYLSNIQSPAFQNLCVLLQDSATSQFVFRTLIRHYSPLIMQNYLTTLWDITLQNAGKLKAKDETTSTFIEDLALYQPPNIVETILNKLDDTTCQLSLGSSAFNSLKNFILAQPPHLVLRLLEKIKNYPNFIKKLFSAYNHELLAIIFMKESSDLFLYVLSQFDEHSLKENINNYAKNFGSYFVEEFCFLVCYQPIESIIKFYDLLNEETRNKLKSAFETRECQLNFNRRQIYHILENKLKKLHSAQPKEIKESKSDSKTIIASSPVEELQALLKKWQEYDREYSPPIRYATFKALNDTLKAASPWQNNFLYLWSLICQYLPEWYVLNLFAENNALFLDSVNSTSTKDFLTLFDEECKRVHSATDVKDEKSNPEYEYISYVNQESSTPPLHCVSTYDHGYVIPVSPADHKSAVREWTQTPILGQARLITPQPIIPSRPNSVGIIFNLEKITAIKTFLGERFWEEFEKTGCIYHSQDLPLLIRAVNHMIYHTCKTRKALKEEIIANPKSRTLLLVKLTRQAIVAICIGEDSGPARATARTLRERFASDKNWRIDLPIIFYDEHECVASLYTNETELKETQALKDLPLPDDLLICIGQGNIFYYFANEEKAEKWRFKFERYLALHNLENKEKKIEKAGHAWKKQGYVLKLSPQQFNQLHAEEKNTAEKLSAVMEALKKHSSDPTLLSKAFDNIVSPQLLCCLLKIQVSETGFNSFIKLISLLPPETMFACLKKLKQSSENILQQLLPNIEPLLLPEVFALVVEESPVLVAEMLIQIKQGKEKITRFNECFKNLSSSYRQYILTVMILHHPLENILAFFHLLDEENSLLIIRECKSLPRVQRALDIKSPPQVLIAQNFPIPENKLVREILNFCEVIPYRYHAIDYFKSYLSPYFSATILQIICEYWPEVYPLALFTAGNALVKMLPANQSHWLDDKKEEKSQSSLAKYRYHFFATERPPANCVATFSHGHIVYVDEKENIKVIPSSHTKINSAVLIARQCFTVVEKDTVGIVFDITKVSELKALIDYELAPGEGSATNDLVSLIQFANRMSDHSFSNVEQFKSRISEKPYTTNTVNAIVNLSQQMAVAFVITKDTDGARKLALAKQAEWQKKWGVRLPIIFYEADYQRVAFYSEEMEQRIQRIQQSFTPASPEFFCHALRNQAIQNVSAHIGENTDEKISAAKRQAFAKMDDFIQSIAKTTAIKNNNIQAAIQIAYSACLVNETYREIFGQLINNLKYLQPSHLFGKLFAHPDLTVLIQRAEKEYVKLPLDQTPPRKGRKRKLLA